MSQKKQLSILEFSRLTGIKRENLRFYDRIGLLSPEKRGENNYRYYSRHQLGTAYLVSSLRGLGVGIEDIKKYSGKRTPESSLALIAQQEERIQAEMAELLKTRQILELHAGMIKTALSKQTNVPFLVEKEAELIFLCPPIPHEMDSDEGGIFSYEYAESNGVNLGFPQGTLIAYEDVLAKNTITGGSYYFKTGTGGNTQKPSGLFASIYGRCSPWNTQSIYTALLDFIKKEGLTICGDAYEEYPLSDLSVQEIEDACVSVEIPVERVAK